MGTIETKHTHGVHDYGIRDFDSLHIYRLNDLPRYSADIGRTADHLRPQKRPSSVSTWKPAYFAGYPFKPGTHMNIQVLPINWPQDKCKHGVPFKKWCHDCADEAELS